MNTSEFAEALAQYSLEEAVQSVLSVLRHKNKGELPEEAKLRDFYASLGPDGQAFADSLTRYATATAIFKILVVLDNCDAIEGGAEKGEFSVHYTRNGVTHRLGDPPDFLHDSFPALSDLVG